MIDNEQWHRWEPLSGLHPKYYIDSISDDLAGFEVLLSEAAHPDKKVRILFKNGVDVYRNTNESFTNELIANLHANYGRSFYVNWTFFKVTDSEYLAWLSRTSSGISDTRPLQHFVILSVETALEIINDYEPEVTFCT